MSIVQAHFRNYLSKYYTLLFNGGGADQRIIHFSNLEINSDWDFVEPNDPQIFVSAQGSATVIDRPHERQIRVGIRMHDYNTHAKIMDIARITRKKYRLCLRIAPVLIAIEQANYSSNGIIEIPESIIPCVIGHAPDLVSIRQGKGLGIKKDDVIPITFHYTKHLNIPGSSPVACAFGDVDLSEPESGETGGTKPVAGAGKIAVNLDNALNGF